ncbi:hypothetical protein DW044_01180 [Lachnospira eligens]|nr:hypothetical protein DW044_01180 [Lachnospira eligens]
MKTLYVNYYREKTNKWIYDLFDYDPFDVVIEVPDFELAPIIANRKGFTELENCKIIYEKLKCISESQASDERLWAGLCNGTFYEYVRNRWGYDMLDFKETKSDADSVLSRFFFKNGKYRNRYQNAGGLDIIHTFKMIIIIISFLIILGQMIFRLK